MKKITLIIILSISLILLCACTPQKSSAGNASESTDASASTQSSTPTLNSDSSQLDQWPDEFKGKLPTPVCKITNVTRYDEKSMSGKLTIVNFTDMSKADAETYVENLKAMGFSGGIYLNDGTKIVFSGVGTDKSATNGVNFMYLDSDQTGMISY